MEVAPPSAPTQRRGLGKKGQMIRAESKASLSHAKKSAVAGRQLLNAIRKKDAKGVENYGRKAGAQLMKSSQHLAKIAKPAKAIGQRTVRKAKKQVRQVKKIFS